MCVCACACVCLSALMHAHLWLYTCVCVHMFLVIVLVGLCVPHCELVCPAVAVVPLPPRQASSKVIVQQEEGEEGTEGQGGKMIR